MSAEIWNTYELAIAATTGGLIVGVATVGLMVLKRLDGSAEVATAKGWWEKAIAVQEANDKARWAPAYSGNLFAIEADKPVDAEVLDVTFPTQEMRLADGLDRLRDEVGLAQALSDCCSIHDGDEPCDPAVYALPCCGNCPDWTARTPALSAETHDDEQAPNEDTDRPRWWAPVVAFVVLAPVAFARRQLPVLVAYVRDRLKSDEQMAAEFMTPAEVEYAGRRRSDEQSTSEAYSGRRVHPDFVTGIHPIVIPAQRDGGDDL